VTFGPLDVSRIGGARLEHDISRVPNLLSRVRVVLISSGRQIERGSARASTAPALREPLSTVLCTRCDDIPNLQ